MSALTYRLCALGLALLIAGCATPASEGAAKAGSAVQEAGIRVESLRLTAAGNMLDLRFRVTDPDHAAPFFSRKTDLYLVDAATGVRLAVPNTPKLGKLRQVARKDMAERSYFVLFANPGRHLKAGSRVELVAGDTRIGQLTVE